MSKPKEDLAIDLDAAMLAEVEVAPVAGHAILSDAEVAAAKKEARDAIEKERKATAIKALIADEKLRLQREEGLVSGDPVKDEMVSLTVDLPEYSASIVINMQPFWHGHIYKVPRHVANSMKEQMQRAWIHQDEIDGKSLAQNLQQRREVVMTRINADALVGDAKRVIA